MTTYTIGEVAERSGFPASTLRYYEQHGLLPPAGRTGAGYRLYDDTSLARLGFIARAKELGCTLEEITVLAELWASDDCEPVQTRLHELVTAKIAETERRARELARFGNELRAAAAHLGGDPVDGPCDAGCACVAAANTPSSEQRIVLGERAQPPIACTLSADDIPQRIDDWKAVTDQVTRREPLSDDNGVRLVLGVSTPIDEVIRLAAAEQTCCSFFSFAITIDDRGTALEVRAPADARPVLEAIFGTG